MTNRAPRRRMFGAVVLSVAAASLLYGGQYNRVVQIGMAAPGFQNLTGIDGQNYSLSDFKEDVVVVVFLANHCPWVRGNDRDLIKLVNDYQGKNVRVWAPSLWT